MTKEASDLQQTTDKIDYKKGERITNICLVGNILLCAVKFCAGIFGRSQAMVADAMHSASDVVATAVVLLGVKIAQKPHDRSHHFGHGKIEYITAAFVGFTLIYAAVQISYSIIVNIASKNISTPTFFAFAAAILSIVVKEMMYRATMKVGQQLNSESIKANAWDHRSDAYSSIGTLIGIGGSILGSYIGIGWLRYLDPIAGGVVALLIFKVAIEILLKAFHGLMDGSPDSEVLEQIHAAATSFPETRELPYVKARYTGPNLWIDMAIRLDAGLTIQEGHEIAEAVRFAICDKISNIDHIIIHVDPCTCQREEKEKEESQPDEGLEIDTLCAETITG